MGGIGEKQVIANGQMTVWEYWEYLRLTLSVDHDVVDGVPAACFIKRLDKLIACSYGLSEFKATSKRAGAENATKRVAAAAHTSVKENANER